LDKWEYYEDQNEKMTFVLGFYFVRSEATTHWILNLVNGVIVAPYSLSNHWDWNIFCRWAYPRETQSAFTSLSLSKVVIWLAELRIWQVHLSTVLWPFLISHIEKLSLFSRPWCHLVSWWCLRKCWCSLHWLSLDFALIKMI